MLHVGNNLSKYDLPFLSYFLECDTVQNKTHPKIFKLERNYRLLKSYCVFPSKVS